MALYWPSSDMTDMERVHKSAARVGLQVPGGNTQARTKEDIQEEAERKKAMENYTIPTARKSLLIDRLMCLAEEGGHSEPEESPLKKESST